jgi:Right handed beta helix region
VEQTFQVLCRRAARPLVSAALVLILGFSSFAQSPSRASGGRSQEITVDGSSGSDGNSGSVDQPLKTVNHAAEIAARNRKNGISTIVTIRPGTYRESVRISGGGPETGARIVFQTSPAGNVILTGSDVWSDWTQDSTNPPIFVHPSDFRGELCDRPSGWPTIKDAALRREMLFVNGKPMLQAFSRGEMQEGSFYVDVGSGAVSLWPPSGTNPSGALIEVAVRPGIFESDAISNLSLNGLIFRHANSCISSKPNAAVVISGGSDVSLENITIQWNNWIGIDLFSVTRLTARKFTSSWNGESGINGFRLRNSLFEDTDTSHNNWRGARGNFTGWEPSGGKFLRLHTATFRRYTAVGNQGRGLWFDTDNTDITVDDSTIEQNLTGGIDLEANVGPMTVQNSRICGNVKEGIQGNQSNRVTLAGNVIYNNGGAQIQMAGIASPRNGTNWETKESFSATSDDWTITQNTVVSTNAKQFVLGTLRLPNQGSGAILNTLHSDQNTWFNSATPSSFQIEPGGANNPGKILNFSQWQETTGQDRNSTFGPPNIDPATSCASH